MAAGRSSEALREILFAQQRDSLSLPINTDLGFHYYYTGRYDDAAKQLKLVLEMGPGFPPAHLWLGRTYQELGKYDDAIAEFRGVDERIRDWPVSIAARRYVAGVSGRQAEAVEALAELELLSGRKFVTSYGVALVHAGLGQNDAAFASLNKAFEGEVELVGLVTPRPALEPTTRRSAIRATGTPDAISALGDGMASIMTKGELV